MGRILGSQAFGQTSEPKTPKGAVTAENASKTLTEANEIRSELFVCNDGENAVYLAFGPTAVAHEGIRLSKEGGSIVITGYTGKVSCITATGTAVVCFSEA